jgi:conjugative transfer signal peptidase TraF
MSLAVVAGIALCVISVSGARDAVLYNPSHSIPEGFYVRASGPLASGAIVTVRAVDVSPNYAALRDFTEPGDRFIKRVVAARGQVICGRGGEIAIDGISVVHRLERDAAGRDLPRWEGCRVLGQGEFLLLGDTADSFDGRYWGPVSAQAIEGVWRPLQFGVH